MIHHPSEHKHGHEFEFTVNLATSTVVRFLLFLFNHSVIKQERVGAITQNSHPGYKLIWLENKDQITEAFVNLWHEKAGLMYQPAI